MADTSSKGTVIRGADGSLYYISDDKLQSFKLPDEQTADARKMLEEFGMKAYAGLVPALHGTGLVKGGSIEAGTYLPVTSKLKSIAAAAYLPAKSKSKSIAGGSYLPAKTKGKSISRKKGS